MAGKPQNSRPNRKALSLSDDRSGNINEANRTSVCPSRLVRPAGPRAFARERLAAPASRRAPCHGGGATRGAGSYGAGARLGESRRPYWQPPS